MTKEMLELCINNFAQIKDERTRRPVFSMKQIIKTRELAHTLSDQELKTLEYGVTSRDQKRLTTIILTYIADSLEAVTVEIDEDIVTTSRHTRIIENY